MPISAIRLKEPKTLQPTMQPQLRNAAANVGLTFLLDGGSTTANGLALAEYEGTEGEIVWVTFEYGSPHKDFVYPDDRDKSVGCGWM